MSVFHPFPRLALELRQMIWELAVEPREVAVARELTRRSYTGPPSILHICVEARHHLQNRYTKSFARKASTKFSLVNFAIDTVYCNSTQLRQYQDTDLPRVQRLIVECMDTEYFFRSWGRALYLAISLETVTILHIDYPAELDERWWMEWDDMMEEWYYRDDPVRFRANVIYLDDPSSLQVTQDNYLRLSRNWRRDHGPTLEEDPDYQGVSDSGDDVDAPWRFRQGYRHVDGCSCSSRR
jgi:hypothetical protein